MERTNQPETADLAHAYPRRHPDVEVTQQTIDGDIHYWLRQPDTNAIIRLTAAEYALWWQMDGQTPFRKLLAYYWRRYQQFPYLHLKNLLLALHADHFILSTAPLETEQKGHPLVGLDDLFNPLAERLTPLFSWIGYLFILFVIYVGGGLLISLLLGQRFSVLQAGGWSLLTLPLAYVVLMIGRQLGRGLWLTKVGGLVTNGRLSWQWLLPHLDLDTRDSQRLSLAQQRWLALSGSVTTLFLAGLMGLILTAVSTYASSFVNTTDRVGQLIFGFLYQFGLLALLHAFLSLNPLARSDGAALLNLTLPKTPLWRRGASEDANSSFLRGQQLRQLVTLLYFVIAFLLLRFLWQDQLADGLISLWRDEPWGRFWMALTSLALLPSFRWLWRQSFAARMQGWEWLEQRPLFIRPDSLFVLLAIPLLGLPFLIIGLGIMLQNDLVATFLIWLLNLGAVFVWYTVATRHPAAAQLTAVFWLLTFTMGCLTLAWLGEALPFLRVSSLLLASSAVLLAGIYAGFTLTPRPLPVADLIIMAVVLLLGIAFGLVLSRTEGELTAVPLFLLGTATLGLASLVPTLRNFRQTDQIYPWAVLAFALLILPWLFVFPQLHFLIVAIWLFSAVFQLVLHTLFHRQEQLSTGNTPFSTTFERFIQRLLDHTTTLIGKRPLDPIHPQLAAVRFHKGQYTVPQQSFLLVTARLSQLSSAALVETLVRLTLQEFPWQTQQQLNKRVLMPTGWDEPLTTLIQEAYSERRELLKQTAVFPNDLLSSLLDIAQEKTVRRGETVATVGTPCTHWYLLLTGRLRASKGVVLAPGSWLGGEAMAGVGVYEETVVAETAVTLLALPYAQVRPLLHRHRPARQRLAQMAHLVPKLKRHHPFRTLPTNSIALLAAHTDQLTLIQDDQTDVGFYFLETGNLQYTDIPSHQLPSPHLFGLETLLASTPQPPRYRATRASRVWHLSPKAFEQLLNGQLFT
ncbi:MAG: cyclic nucleotide-binding domain-containing protein [Chloroflexota bacterium]